VTAVDSASKLVTISAGRTQGVRVGMHFRIFRTDVVGQPKDEVAVLEAAEEGVAGVPQPGGAAAGAVAEHELDVLVALAVDPQLLGGGEEHLVEVLAVAQLFDVAAGHEVTSCPCGG